MATAHIKEPGWFARNVFNRGVALATRLGLSVAGSRVLEVKLQRVAPDHPAFKLN